MLSTTIQKNALPSNIVELIKQIRALDEKDNKEEGMTDMSPKMSQKIKKTKLIVLSGT